MGSKNKSIIAAIFKERLEFLKKRQHEFKEWLDQTKKTPQMDDEYDVSSKPKVERILKIKKTLSVFNFDENLKPQLEKRESLAVVHI